MKTLITIICIFLFLNLSAKTDSVKIGYLVCTTTTSYMNVKKVSEIEIVQEIFNFHFCTVHVDLKEEMKNAVYFQILTSNHGIYIEKKIINRKGKYKRITQRQIKKYKLN